MKKFVLFAAALLAMLAVPAFAALFTVTAGPAGEVFAEDSIDVTITIHNDASTEQMFLISQPLAAPPANKWASADKGSLSVPAYGDNTFKIRIAPFADAVPGDYRFEFTVKKDSTGEMASKEFQVTVRQREAAAGVKLTLSCSECSDKLSIKADVDNYGTAKLKDTVVKLTVGEKTVELPVGEVNVSKKAQVSTDVDLKNWKPMAYTVSAELTANGQSLDRETAGFTISEIKNIVITQAVESTPWSKNVILKAENLGNVMGPAEIKAQVQQSVTVSISYSEPPTARGDQWTWSKTLQPGETAEVSYSEFYWPVPIVIVLVVLGAAYAYLFMTSIGMKKVVSKHGHEWSVGIYIKNRGPAAEGVVVRDVIPHHFSLSGTFETLKPIARKTETGTELIWRVGGIKRGEEKLLHYRMAAKAPFRTARLASARLRAQKGDKTILSSTNTVTLTGDKTPPKLSVETK